MTHVKTFDAAHGRWREILPALGIPEQCLSGKNQPCPLCGGKDRFRFSLNDPTRSGGYYCNQCGSGNGMELLKKFHGWDFKRAADEIDKIIGNLPQPSNGPEFYTTRAANPASCRRMYADSSAVARDDAVALYLAERHLADSVWPRALRTIEKLQHKPTSSEHHGMLAVFSTADGKPATIHRTYLTRSGCKADVEPVRMFMPGEVPSGGAIRLGCAAEVMGVAEGIETALSASRLYRMPVWATTSELLLSKWLPPSKAKHIAIFGDNDKNFVGQSAAYALAKRLMFEANKEKIEREVEVHIPAIPGFDWNDVLIARSEVTCE